MTAGDFSAYTAWSAEGRRIAIVTCLRCGAAVLVDEEHATLKHLQWHLTADAAIAKAPATPVTKDSE